MSSSVTGHSPLPSPVADTFSVERLVGYVKAGRIRIPPFQRGLSWNSEDVVQLLDSMYRGYPIGALLFHKSAAPAAVVALGPLRIEAGETPDAMYVVDGQQRIVSLTASLGRSLPLPSDGSDPYIVYFDPEKEVFISPSRHDAIPDTWAPVPALGDGSGVHDWLYAYPHRDDVTLRKRILEASTRLREYKLPAYIVEHADADTLRDIFFRINKSGKSLKWEDVHLALYGRRDDADPSSLPELSTTLAALGFGTLDEALLLRCLLAWQGLDVTRTLAEHERRDPGFLSNATAEALPALRATIDFLRRDAKIPHLRLVPSTAVLPPLCRFFRRFPQPDDRNRVLLRRVIWRFLLASNDDRSFQRQAVAAVSDGNPSESAAVQALLSVVASTRPPAFSSTSVFDARARESRIAALALASLGPRELNTHQPIDLAEAGLRQVVAGSIAEPITRSAANRILLPGHGLVRRELLEARAPQAVLASHAISSEALESLRRGDTTAFLLQRSASIDEALARFGDRHAEWGASDRPAIHDILAGLE